MLKETLQEIWNAIQEFPGAFWDGVVDMTNNTWENAQDAWLDYAEWAVGFRDAEQAYVFTIIALLLLTSVVLSGVMFWRRPETLLENALMWREFAKSALWCALLYATHYHETLPTVPRLSIYTGIFITSALVVWFVARTTIIEEFNDKTN